MTLKQSNSFIDILIYETVSEQKVFCYNISMYQNESQIQKNSRL